MPDRLGPNYTRAVWQEGRLVRLVIQGNDIDLSNVEPIENGSTVMVTTPGDRYTVSIEGYITRLSDGMDLGSGSRMR